MPVSCCAPACTERFKKGSGVRFFRFPKSIDRKLKWQIALKRMDINNPSRYWEPSDHDRLCSLHFISGEPSTDPCHPDYVPSVFSFNSTPQSERKENADNATPAKVERFERVKRRRLILSPASQDKENQQPSASQEQQCEDEQSAVEALLGLGHDIKQFSEKGTDPGPDPLQQQYLDLQTKYSSLQKEYQRVLDENRELKEQQESSHPT